MSAALAVKNPRQFVASAYQQRFFDWVANGKGSAILKAVAGSGKSTSIVRALDRIPANSPVLILAFNAPIAKEMREKIVAFGIETGRTFANVEASTFHSRGFRMLGKRLGRDGKIEVDEGKVRKILKDRLSEAEYEMYGDFVNKLVGFAKGLGVGIPGLAPDEVEVWRAIIASQDMWLDDEAATEERAIDVARKALRASNGKAASDRWIDFNDQLYLPLLWNLRFFTHEWVFLDEAQDTNPVRREFAKRSLKNPRAPYGGRLVAVGDPCQAIYAFTGASSNAMDLIAAEFDTVELPLTVSYRCPRAVGELARAIVPYFEVADGAPEGRVRTLKVAEALRELGPADAIVCRQTAPLIALAFRMIGEGRPCFVLGRDVGAGLAALIKKLRAQGVDGLLERLEGWREKELAKLKDQPAKAEAVEDRVEAIRTIAGSLSGRDRTIPGVLARIDELFAEGGPGERLTLATGHRVKGKEFPRVGILRPDLIPSKAAKTDEAYQQELNLLYVMETRPTDELIFMEGDA